MGREDARHLGERAGLFEDDDAQSRIAPLAVLLPAQVDPVRVDAVGQARAVDDMHLDPFAWPREADDAVTRHRVAAIGELVGDAGGQPRSEEHTSELQSLMRISYAVFCLKKTNKNNQLQT